MRPSAMSNPSSAESVVNRHNEGHGRRLTAAFQALEAFPALVLRAAATVAAVATGATTPESGIASGLSVLTDPGRPARAFEAPGLSAIAYWSVVTVFLIVLATFAWCVWRLVARLRHRERRRAHVVHP
jgi:hypothetical protein